MGADAFQGVWRVREAVFAPDGARLGEVAQRRQLAWGEDGLIRVVQDCVPDAALAAHPMGRFAGHHEFALVREGAFRRYLGPAVIGSAIAIGEDALQGRGVWPAFGWSFTSWSATIRARRQLTGGRFFRGGHAMATVVGVAEPEGDEAEAPRLGLDGSPARLAAAWRGVLFRVDGAGRRLAEESTTRVYRDEGRWTEAGGRGAAELRIELAARSDVPRVRGSVGERKVEGLHARYGPLLEIDAAVGADTHLEATEILDEESKRLLVFRRWLVDHVLQRTEVLRLQPEPT